MNVGCICMFFENSLDKKDQKQISILVRLIKLGYGCTGASYLDFVFLCVYLK